MLLEEKSINDMKKKMTRKTQRQLIVKIIYQTSITNDFTKIENVYMDYKKKSTTSEINSENIKDFDDIEHINNLISNFSSLNKTNDFKLDEIISSNGKILYKKSGNYEYLYENLSDYNDIEYLNTMIDIYFKNKENINKEIELILSDSWKINRLSKIDLAIIRTAILDMSYMNIPYKVAINEALNIAKEYSDEKSSRFINGVLKEYVKKFFEIEEK